MHNSYQKRKHYRVAAKQLQESPEKGIYVPESQIRQLAGYTILTFLLFALFALLEKKI